MQRRAATLRAAVRFVDARPDLLATGRVAVIDGDPVAPPQLARDTPVADVLHPVVVDAREALRNDADATLAHGLQRGVRQRLDAQVPLVEQQRLQHGARALAVPHLVGVGILFHDLASRFQLRHEPLARFLRRQTSVVARGGVHRAVEVHHVDRGQVVALRDLEVRRVVRRSELHRAGAELHLHHFVGHDRADPPGVWNAHVHADERFEARIVRMHRHADVAEDRLGARGGDGDEFLRVLVDRVAHIGQRALDLAVLHLEVRQHRLAVLAPVGDAVAAINQAFFEQADERRPHRAHVVRIHREHVARPVGGGAQLAQLVLDLEAVGLHPFPHLVEELLATQVVAIQTSGLQVTLDHELARDARVVATGHPEARIAEHAVPADHDVFERDEERVTVVQTARDVGRRHGDDERVPFAEVRVRLRLEQAVLGPEVVPVGFSLGGVVRGVACFGGAGHGALELKGCGATGCADGHVDPAAHLVRIGRPARRGRRTSG